MLEFFVMKHEMNRNVDQNSVKPKNLRGEKRTKKKQTNKIRTNVGR